MARDLSGGAGELGERRGGDRRGAGGEEDESLAHRTSPAVDGDTRQPTRPRRLFHRAPTPPRAASAPQPPPPVGFHGPAHPSGPPRSPAPRRTPATHPPPPPPPPPPP